MYPLKWNSSPVSFSLLNDWTQEERTVFSGQGCFPTWFFLGQVLNLAVFSICGFIYFCFTNCLHFLSETDYLMADSHFVNLSHLMCQHALLLVHWTVRCNNAGNVQKPRNISTKKHDIYQDDGRKKTSRVFARKQGLEQDFIMISNTRTYLYFTFKRTDFDNYTLWLCSIHSSAKLDYHRLELQYLKAARTVYSVGSEPESPLRQFFRSIWTPVFGRHSGVRNVTNTSK